MPTAYDSLTGWNFDYADVAGRPPPGGLTLTNMQHWGHNFCRDLRLIGIRMWMDEVTPADAVVRTTSHFLPLSNPPFQVDHQQLIMPSSTSISRVVSDVTRFNTYFASGALALRGDYTLGAPFVETTWPNCEFARMIISQRFLFSPYNASPRHEPSGGLNAARCHPMTRFDFHPNDALDRTRNRWRMSRIRFDYRLHLFLDRHHASPTTLANIGNNAGLFRDHEAAGVGGLLVQAGRTIVTLAPLAPSITPQGFSNIAFAAIEKPLVLEVATYGLHNGGVPIGDARVWDNLHWWGTRGSGAMISAPGGFHAAHIHWRWGGAGYNMRSRIPEIDDTGSPEHTAQLDPNTSGVTLESLCPEDWQTLFTGHHATPNNIEAGRDIVMWYSAEAHREVTYTPSGGSRVTARLRTPGTVFLHGIFFAHDPEQTAVVTAIGPTTAEHRPRTHAQILASLAWQRLA